MRQVGITFSLAAGETAQELAAVIKRAGFDTTIISYVDGDVARAECRAALDAGLAIDHIHSPYIEINDIWAPEENEASENYLFRLLDCLDCCREYGVKKMVVHVSSGNAPPAVNEVGLSRFDRLMEHAVRCGVTVAYENLRRLDYLETVMERYPQAAFCWDVGHEVCFTGGLAFMPLFGERIACLHLHDNLGVYNQDSHLIPFDGVIDLKKAAASLKQYGYTGPVLLESFRAMSKPEQQERYGSLTAQEYFRRAYEAAVKFRAWLDE